MTITAAEREKLVELWGRVPGTMPPQFKLDEHGDAIWHGVEFEYVPPSVVAALSRDAITNYIISEGYQRFDWDWNSDTERVTLDIGIDDEPHSGKTQLLALIEAANAVGAVKGGGGE